MAQPPESMGISAEHLAIDPDLDDRIKGAIDREMGRQNSSGAFGLWAVDNDGDDLWLDAYVVWFENDRGGPGGLLGIPTGGHYDTSLTQPGQLVFNPNFPFGGGAVPGSVAGIPTGLTDNPALQNIRTAVQHLRAVGPAELARMTLMSDGATVYECSSPYEVHALLQGGQGVFGIAVGVVWRDVENALSQLHGERVDTGETLVGHNPADELARRRNRAV